MAFCEVFPAVRGVVRADRRGAESGQLQGAQGFAELRAHRTVFVFQGAVYRRANRSRRKRAGSDDLFVRCQRSGSSTPAWRSRIWRPGSFGRGGDFDTLLAGAVIPRARGGQRSRNVSAERPAHRGESRGFAKAGGFVPAVRGGRTVGFCLADFSRARDRRGHFARRVEDFVAAGRTVYRADPLDRQRGVARDLCLPVDQPVRGGRDTGGGRCG